MLAASGCEDQREEMRPFATAPVRIGPLIDSVLATGRVQTVVSVDVSSQLSGRVDDVYVDFNDTVDQGDPLARLDPQRFQSRVEELEAALAVAEAELQAVDASLAGARAGFEEDDRDYQRKLGLAAKGSVSDSEVSKARALKLRSESALSTLLASREIKAATITAARASLRQAQIDLERTTIRTPIAGVVIKRSVEPGQTVAVSLSAPELFTIANDLGEIEVLTHVDEADIGKVHPGQEVTFTVDAYPERRFVGQVQQIRKAPEIVQNVVTYSVIVSATNPEALMLPGMTALVEIITARKDEVLQVPNAALRFRMPPEVAGLVDDPSGAAQAMQSAVWLVLDGDGFRRTPIQVGYSDGEYSEVVAGALEEGDSLVVGYR